MVELIKDLPPAVTVALLTGSIMCFIALIKAAAWFFEQWWVDRKVREQNASKALSENTLAIQRLELQIDRLNEFLHVIPKLQSDINLAHEKLREMKREPVRYTLP